MPERIAPPIGCLVAGLLLVLLPTAAHALPLTAQMAGEIEKVLREPEAPRIHLDRPILLEDDILPRFYRERDYRPAWFDDRGLSGNGRRLLGFLRDSGREGLCAEDYHLEPIELLVELEGDSRVNGFLFDPGYMAFLDLMLTDAFLDYADHLLEGRIDPERIHVGWRAHLRRADFGKLLRRALSEDRVGEVLEGLTPPHEGYVKLKEALADYRRLSALGGWPKIPEGPVLRTGRDDVRVPRLRKRLRMTGDLPAEWQGPDELYDRATARALARFQRRHGLAADGVLGPRTLAALNVPVEARIRQIEVNLERWRWLPKSLGRRYLLVNIADYSLRVVEEGRTVMSMSVVVGTGFRKTPVFSARMSYLEFAPYWNVPPTILREDKLPLIRRDPGWLTRHHYELLHYEGEETLPVDPLSIPWETIDAEDVPGVLRMKPGPWNPLGRVKFMFPNRFSVYLHDTSERYLFARRLRSFSSGCIRVEHPLDLAQYLLEGSEWDCGRILDAMESAAPVQVDLPESIPVHILYWTAWVDEGGELQFRDDIYQRDLDMALALERRHRWEGKKGSEEIFQPAEGDHRADGRAEGGEYEDQQHPGQAVAPPAAQMDQVVAHVFQIPDGRRGDEGLHQAGDHAGADGGVQ